MKVTCSPGRKDSLKGRADPTNENVKLYVRPKKIAAALI